MKKSVCIILSLIMILSLAGCGSSEYNKTLNILALKGPTGMGMAKMITDENSNYNFSVISDPTMIASYLSNGDVDIAACPLNMASVLYNKMNSNLKILAINTLGTLYILDMTNAVESVDDLKGKTVVTSGQGATPEYALNYLLEMYGIKDDVKVEYKSEHSEVASAILSGKADVVMLPEPNVSVVLSKNNEIKIAVNVAQEIEEKNGLQFAMGCVVAKKDFVENNPDLIKRFLKDYKKSVNFINTSDKAGSYICNAGILDNENIAQKSIKTSSIVFVQGEEMKKIANDNFKLLFNANPKSIGGKIPDESILYFEG